MVAERGFEYNGLALGSGTKFGVVEAEGIYDMDAKYSDLPKPQDHGSFISARLALAKVIVLTGNLSDISAAEFATRIGLLRKATQPQTIIRSLAFRFPGESERLIYCTPRRRHLPIDIHYVQSNFATWIVEFLAGDPRVYSIVEGELDGAGIASNEGDFPTPPAIIIRGPSSNPTITKVNTGEVIRVATEVPTGQDLMINVSEKTVKLNGVSIYGSYDQSVSSWFQLDPGDNELSLTGGGIIETRWRHAWI